ncbi:uncharacterized protein LOC131496421 [Neofelis nebulosa]|uniref:uncharacterized protein LOC131496421 n=1 Tax=Neofelis nebulosa TaxID=61452 RepID=UPI00272D8551|nr:uncharacterized protein LOC131496421 [Neofelis nebulosa]
MATAFPSTLLSGVPQEGGPAPDPAQPRSAPRGSPWRRSASGGRRRGGGQRVRGPAGLCALLLFGSSGSSRWRLRSWHLGSVPGPLISFLRDPPIGLPGPRASAVVARGRRGFFRTQSQLHFLEPSHIFIQFTEPPDVTCSKLVWEKKYRCTTSGSLQPPPTQDTHGQPGTDELAVRPLRPTHLPSPVLGGWGCCDGRWACQPPDS